jgi:hypothetical protein
MKQLTSIMLLLALAGSACGQEVAAIILRDSVGNDVTRSIGLERGPAAAASNSAKLNAAIRDVGDRRYTFSFPAGDWYFGADTTNDDINGTCIELARSSGQSLVGKGLAAPRSETDNNGELPTATRLIYAGPKISLVDLTHSLSEATLTIDPEDYTVKEQDKGATVQITDGAGVSQLPSFYVITSVDTGSNTWTFDRAPGGSAMNLKGLMTYTLIRDPGYGTSYKGLYLKGNPTVGGTKCHVGMHFVSDFEAPQLNCGKGLLEQLCFSDFTAAVLSGRDMRLAYGGAGASYTGEADDHCDQITMIRPFWFNCRTGYYMRNVQSVCNDIISPRHFGDGNQASEVVYAERGGEVLVSGGDFSGNDVTALRLGKNGSNTGGFHVMDCRYDSNSARPIWLKMDYDIRDHNQVTFQNCRLDEGIPTYATPAWHAKGGTRLVLDNCSPIREDFVQLTQNYGGTEGLYWTPHCEIRSCTITNLGAFPPHDEPWQVIHSSNLAEDGESEPITVSFSGCNTNHEGSVVYDNGRWVMDGSPDWAAGWPLPTTE